MFRLPKLVTPRSSKSEGRDQRSLASRSEVGPKFFSFLKPSIRVLALLGVLVYFLFTGSPTRAIICGGGDYFRCLQEIEAYRRKLSELSAQRNTLTNQIAYLNNQINLTQLEIQVKQAEIDALSGDIGDLAIRLDRISSFLQYQEDIFVNRARLAYVSDQLSSFDIVLGAESLDDAMRRIKYLRVLEDHDIQFLNEMRGTRANFNDQKTTLENRKAEVEQLKTKLAQKQRSLAQQKDSREQLLRITKNDEQTYQRILREAQSELEAIRNAVRLRGGASPVRNQPGCVTGNCYYNQRDSRWFYTRMGLSNLATGEFGCLVASVAMVAGHYGRRITPGDISSSIPSAFFHNTAFLNRPEINVNGVRVVRTRSRVGYDSATINVELAAGRPVIVGVRLGGHNNAHFVVLKSGSGGQYVMSDPWYSGAHNIPFSRYYSPNQITATDVVRVF